VNQRPKVSVGTIAAAIVIAGVVVSAGSLFVASSNREVTRTVTQTASTGLGSIMLYKVIFNETGINCGWGNGSSYVSRWYVTLGNVTIVQPSNATLPFPDPNLTIYGDYGMISKIIFTVPDGSYLYYGSFGLNGIANVNGSNVVIQVNSYPVC
jgi:hypothetical protein